MKQSQLLGKTRRDGVKDEPSINAQLLTRGGFIDKLMSGVYTFLPLGQRVLSKIENIIRDEMQAIGSQELLLPALHPAEVWETTGRWNDFDALFKLKSRSGDRQYGLGPTHEEVVTPLVQKFVGSYRDLPVSVFQMQTKFRDEPRARSGLLRGREFRMKDMYSFHETQEDLDRYYEIAAAAYKRIFDRLGLGESTFFTYASGGSFSKYSHEFQTVVASGEDTIFVCRKKGIAVNKEIFEEVRDGEELKDCEFTEERAIEVGNIFKLGTRFSQPFGMEMTGKDGQRGHVVMGCYGMGPSRIMGTIVELRNDANGIIWPKAVAPCHVHLVSLGSDEKIVAQSEKVYGELTGAGVEVLFDDRTSVSNGAKLKDCDLIGIPTRVVLSGKTLEKGCAEVKARAGGESKLVALDVLTKHLTHNSN